jgi:hypothetical protein
MEYNGLCEAALVSRCVIAQGVLDDRNGRNAAGRRGPCRKSQQSRVEIRSLGGADNEPWKDTTGGAGPTL